MPRIQNSFSVLKRQSSPLEYAFDGFALLRDFFISRIRLKNDSYEKLFLPKIAFAGIASIVTQHIVLIQGVKHYIMKNVTIYLIV